LFDGGDDGGAGAAAAMTEEGDGAGGMGRARSATTGTAATADATGAALVAALVGGGHLALGDDTLAPGVPKTICLSLYNLFIIIHFVYHYTFCFQVPKTKAGQLLSLQDKSLPGHDLVQQHALLHRRGHLSVRRARGAGGGLSLSHYTRCL
jgi:hypothetical protein